VNFVNVENKALAQSVDEVYCPTYNKADHKFKLYWSYLTRRSKRSLHCLQAKATWQINEQNCKV